MAADLAPDLRFYLAIVIVEIVVRGLADWTNDQFGDSIGPGPAPDRLKRFTVKRLVVS